MELESAVALVLSEVDRRGQNQVAELLGVSSGTITKWRAGTRPQGDTKRRVLEFAEALVRERPPEIPREVLIEAIQRSGENLARLAEVRGMAEAVLQILRGVADQQQLVVDSLAPWSAAEGRVLAGQELAANVPEAFHEQIRESVRQSAAKAEAAQRATKKASGA